MVVFMPTLINTIVNGRIFLHVRSSVHRIQPTTVTAFTNANNPRKPKISRREISLLRRMIFMFLMFIGGWGPVYLVIIFSYVVYLDPIIFQFTVLLGELTILSIIINLFMCNHELKEYLLNKIKTLFRC